ncbi:MAG: hypothetical protein RIC15_08205 [Vicingaceae bacterium]
MEIQDPAIKMQLNDISTANDAELLNMLPELRKSGRSILVQPLIKRWRMSQSEELSEALFHLFCDIKDQETLSYFMEAISVETDNHFLNSLLSVLWLSSLDASEHLHDLISVALSGDFMTVVEVSTIIENMDVEFNEDEVMEAMYQIDERLTEESDQEYIVVFQQLKEIVNKLNVS